MAQGMIMRRGGAAATGLPEFTYTGTYLLLDDGDGNWRIKFLTSGTLVMQKSVAIDAFLVGAGAGGASTGNTNPIYGARGGGAGYTYKNSATLVAGTEYQIAIGAGGAAAATQTTEGNTEIHGGNGGATSAFGYSASGGYGNANGGSGGAGSNGNPGTDGGNGTGYNAGTGQGATTREFGESTGALYATGGRNAASTAIGDASTGDGGYGGYYRKAGANGRSGIVVIRNYRAA